MNFLITGGASGLGLAITKEIAGSPLASRVHFTFNHSVGKAKELETSSPLLHGIKCDFRNSGDLYRLCHFIGSEEIDILINNAITGLDKQYFHKTDKEQFINSFAADILPTLEITRSFILKARQRKSGKIITILSAGLEGNPPIGWSVYLANKAYLLAMHRSWSEENKAFNISSVCVSPDFMVTPLHKDLDERMIEYMIQKHPAKKLLNVEEVARVVLSLCDPGSQMNGKNILVRSQPDS